MSLIERSTRFLQRSFAGRCLYRFVELEGVDRALALSSRAFVAVIPLAVVATALTPAGDSFGDRLVERFALEGKAAQSLRQLFETPSEVRGKATVVGLLALLVTCLSFARLLQRTYERIWELEALGPRGILRGLAWIGLFSAWVAFVIPTRDWLRDLGGTTLFVVVDVAASTVLWLWTPYVLLGGRIHWRRLLPGALVTAVGLTVLTAVSILYLPGTIDRSAEAYGLIGVTFAFVSWLFTSALVIVASAVVGAEASSSLSESRRRSPGTLETP